MTLQIRLRDQAQNTATKLAIKLKAP